MLRCHLGFILLVSIYFGFLIVTVALTILDHEHARAIRPPELHQTVIDTAQWTAMDRQTRRRSGIHWPKIPPSSALRVFPCSVGRIRETCRMHSYTRFKVQTSSPAHRL